MYTDKEIIEGIASNCNKTLDFIYREMFPYVDHYIRQNGGSTEQARDIFQDAMIVLFEKITNNQLILQCKFNTYLFAVCKRIWIQENRKRRLHIKKMQENPHAAEPSSTYEAEEEDICREILTKHFEKLSPDCQKILRMFFNGANLEDIKKEFGYSSIQNASDKKYRCKKNLIERISNDPRYIKLMK